LTAARNLLWSGAKSRNFTEDPTVMPNSKFVSRSLFSILFLSLAACGTRAAHNTPPPVAVPFGQTAQTETLSTLRPSANPDTTHSTSIAVSAVVDKAALLSQEFLYGADLQYSSYYDAGMDLYNQSLAIGHIPARFRIASAELQLVADNRRLYPSEVNHPEQLLARFQILSESESTLTVSAGDSSILLAQIFEGTRTDTAGHLYNPKGPAPRDHWTRSFEFVSQGALLLQQTSVVLADGTIGEFMESIQPRAALATGEAFEKFEMDPENPAGGDDGWFERFRLLAGERIFLTGPDLKNGEKKVSFAQHYDISRTPANPEGTIDWYATRNIPDEAIEPVREAVEGWNRYFRAMKGVERDVVRFRGRLPEAIHLGDPRFNVINWDSRLIAGAAYESQATDPHTGKQSHSLIYMPAAWLQIGQTYWKNGRFSDNSSVGSTTANTGEGSVSATALAGHRAVSSARLACLRDVRGEAETVASGRLNQDEIKEFGIRLLKGTLFHEVGHALGLAHNFKGSLVFDRSKPDAIFSTSIMDYNHYEIERAAFPELHGADGPQLEYDRQILSAIYNQGKDVASDAPVVPMCNDEEADTEDDGVDPLCIRYDVEKDPTLANKTALDRLELAEKAGDVTLSQAFARVPNLLLTDEAVASIQKTADLKAAVAKAGEALKGAAVFHLTSGKSSLGRVVRLNLKSLLKFEDDILPSDYSAQEMRERAFDGLRKGLALKELPAASANALEAAEKAVIEKLSQSPAAGQLGGEERTQLLKQLAETLHKATASINTDEAVGLPKVRSSILATLARHKKVPFFFEAPLDFETSILGVLGDAVTSAQGSASERKAAAGALITYKGRSSGGDAAISATLNALKKQLGEARNNESRELIEDVLTVLQPAQAGGDGEE
jgi:hypothetical protein